MSQQGVAGVLNDDSRLGGIYQLGVRLHDPDEVSGSAIRFTDIRYAENGIELQGLAAHSPLVGEASEANVANDTFDLAQNLGNILHTDRAAISLAGNLSSSSDVDWFTFEVAYEDSTLGGSQPTSVVFDLDYADQLGRPNAIIYLFTSDGKLVYVSDDGAATDDLPAPGENTDLDDLSRGSVGGLDPFLGPVSLRNDTYYVAVTSRGMIPAALADSSTNDPGGNSLLGSPLTRLEPANILTRIAEDHVSYNGGATADPPLAPFLLAADGTSEIPFHLGDVTLFVTSGAGQPTTLSTVNPLSGQLQAEIGRFNRSIADMDLRWNGQLRAFTSDYNAGNPTDDNTGNYLNISTVDASILNADDVPDDGIETYEEGLDDEGMPTGEADRSPAGDNDDGVGIHFEAMTFSIDLSGRERLFAVGNRPAAFNMPQSITLVENILYELDPDTGLAISNGPQRPDDGLIDGAGTQIVELGELLTTATAGGDNALIVVAATNAAGAQIVDGLTFGTGGTTFEFVSGPEVTFVHTAAGGAFVRDGDQFTLTDAGGTTTRLEFDTGSVLVVQAANGNQIQDGDTFTLVDNQAVPVSKTFEFNDGTGGPIGSGNVEIAYTAADNQPTLVNKILTAINAVPNFNLNAQVVVGNRISLVNESATIGATSTGIGVTVEGAPGVAPGAVAIRMEEFFNTLEFGSAVQVSTPAPLMASFDGTRMNFPGANTADFTTIVGRGVFTDLMHDGTPAPGNVAIPFQVSDTANDIATRVTQALAGNGITATMTGRVVTLGTGSYTSADPPLQIGGSAPGGLITGLAEVGGEIFAVSDAGGLFLVDAVGGAATYVASSVELAGLNFQGLASGPENAEDGRFAETLFGIEGDGTIHAFNTAGELQPVFFQGESALPTGIGGADGLAFSTLDFNLWHQTDTRTGDEGHQILQPFDTSRDAESANGNFSYYFGYEGRPAHGLSRDPLREPGVNGTYNFPGGAQGSLETEHLQPGRLRVAAPTGVLLQLLPGFSKQGLCSEQSRAGYVPRLRHK